MPMIPSSLPHVTLASGSPRRQQLLRQIGVEFVVLLPNVEEIHVAGELPGDFVRRLSLEKARSVEHSRTDGVVLGSDTIVVLEGEILGKPADPDDARRMLQRLSGHTHIVFTGYALIDIGSGREVVGHEETSVRFRPLDDEEIDRYIATGTPLDKAGSYGIQDDFGAVFVERITGDYYTVVGLPLSRVYQELRRIGEPAPAAIPTPQPTTPQASPGADLPVEQQTHHLPTPPMADTVFSKILRGEISVDLVHEDDLVVAFRDIAPQGPVHILVIPRKEIATTNDITEEDEPLVGHMIRVATEIARAEGIADTGYRLVFNCNHDGGQDVHHIHVHLIGGRKMTWPPG